MEEIMQEKISADHLLYVSLKYTKTCDVIVNLLLRWKELIDVGVDCLLRHAKSKKKIPSMPSNPVGKIDAIKKLFKKDEGIMEALELYEMFKKIRELRLERIGEFRKNVNLKVYYTGKEININLEKLKEYAEKIDNYVKSIKKFKAS